MERVLLAPLVKDSVNENDSRSQAHLYCVCELVAIVRCEQYVFIKQEVMLKLSL